MVIVIIDQSGNPRTFYEESHAIRAIKKLVNDGVSFQVSHEVMKSEKPKFYGFMAGDNEFIERISVNKVNAEISIWNCRRWDLSGNKLSNPEPLTLPSMMVQKKTKCHQVFFYNGSQISSRELHVHALDVREN